MTVQTQYGGISKAVEKTISILYFCETSSYSGATKTSVETNDSSLSDIEGLTPAGAIHVDGLTIAENAEEGESYPDWSGNIFDFSEGSSSPTINFKLLEVLNANTAKLVFKNVTASVGGEGDELESINGFDNPTDKTLVIDTRIKNKVMRIVLPSNTFQSRGDIALLNDDLTSFEVTYGVVGSPSILVRDLSVE